MRTGYTSQEVLTMNSNDGTRGTSSSMNSTPSPTTMMMSSSTMQKKRIDRCLDSVDMTYSESEENHRNSMNSIQQYMMMQQMAEDRRQEETWRRDREVAVERERFRREELREAREREERLDILREARRERRILQVVVFASLNLEIFAINESPTSEFFLCTKVAQSLCSSRVGHCTFASGQMRSETF